MNRYDRSGYGGRGDWGQPGEYGGMRSDARPERWRSGGRGEFGWGGGTYDTEYGTRSDAGARRGFGGGARYDSESIRAGDIMTPHPECVTENTSLSDATRLMAACDVGVVPVVESNGSGRLLGLITDRDVAVRAVARGASPDSPVEEFMTGRIRTVHPETPLREVIRTMSWERVRRMPVVERDGRLVGIISQADLAVDYAGFDPEREREVEEMIERISEPGHPREPRRYPDWSPRGRPAGGEFDYW